MAAASLQFSRLAVIPATASQLSERSADAEIAALLAAGLTASIGNARRGSFAIGSSTFDLVGPDSPIVSRMIDHLIPTMGASQLTIHVVDGRSHAATAPPSWNLPHANARHFERIHLAADGMLSAQYDPDRRIWSILDRKSATGLLWVCDLELLPSWDVAAPFRVLLNWFLAPSPLTIVHAGAIAMGDVAFLLVGAGGSGKSTTAAAHLALQRPGLGDDLVVAGLHEGVATVFALYDAFKLDVASPFARQFGFSELDSMESQSKRVYRYSSVNPTSLVRSRPLRAILTVGLANSATTRIVPATAAEVLRELAPSTLFLLRGEERSSFSKIVSLVRSLPGYALYLGDDPLTAAQALADWAESLVNVR